MDLFTSVSPSQLPGTPLAEKLRPKRIEDILGQQKAIGQNSFILNLIKAQRLPSLIIWGPPGTGKTTFAQALAAEVSAEFVALNAIEVGAKQLREIGEHARTKRQQFFQQTVLFVDEIHRFNKSQQDVLLPFVEKGELVLIGATTENPSYEINQALLSRCKLLVFQRLESEALCELVEKACSHYSVQQNQLLDSNSTSFLIEWSDGDARKLLNTMELILDIFQFQGADYQWPLQSETLQVLIGQTAIRYDKQSDEHYDLVSAFIKSIRGSDPQAGLYYLARMLKGGEDPKFIARRLVILASEDVGNADPRALSIAVATFQAVEVIGMPECGINLAQAVTYLSSAPKSNRSYLGYKKALDLVDKTGAIPVPLDLRSSKTQLMKQIGYGKNYQYPHDYPKSHTAQNYLPDTLVNEVFYEPKELGFEKNIIDYLKWMKKS